MTPAFSDAAIQGFLATKEVVVLATLNESGAPLAMPMWFVHDQAHIAFVSVDGLAKVRNVERDGRVSVVAEGGRRGAVQGIVMAGEAAFCTGVERELWGQRFHARYSPDVERLWNGSAIPDNRRIFSLRPRVLSAWGL